MNLKLIRIKQGRESTLSEIYINNQLICFGLENAVRKTKIKGITAIPTGRYLLRFNVYGAMNARYKKRFPGIHQGMIEITGIPNFSYVYFHIGNNIGDTAGCILLGNKMALVDGDYEVYQSKKAYLLVYQQLVKMMMKGKVFVEVIE